VFVAAEERWREMRTLYEWEGVAPRRLATVGMLTEKAVVQRAAREGWIAPEDRGVADLTRIRALQAIAMAEVDAAMAVGEGAAFDKVRIETAASALKVVEKLLDTTRAALLAQQQVERARLAEEGNAECTAKEQEERDAEIAEILESIEDQIDRLARDYAAELAGNPNRPEQDRADLG